MSIQPLSHYRVTLRSAPGMWERYTGHVDVWAASEDQARRDAPRTLICTSFPNRPMDGWIIDSVERLSE